MTSTKAWTAVLRGYFHTTILPKIWGEMGFRHAHYDTMWTLAKVQADLSTILRGQYGDMADEENAVQALATYVPSWDWDTDPAADGPTFGARSGGGTWTWNTETGLLMHIDAVHQ